MVKRTPKALPPNLPPRGLSRDEAAEYLGLGTTLFDELIKQGAMPEPVKAGGRVVWDRFALDRAFEALPTRQSDTEESNRVSKAIDDEKW